MNMRKKMQTGNGGFTLIEVVLSIAILALISVPLINYFTDSMKHAVKTQEKQNATLVAQDAMEFIKAQSKLMHWTGAPGASGGTVMHFDITDPLKEKFNVPLNEAIEVFDVAHLSSVYDRNDGKGTLTYDYNVSAVSGDEYELHVELSTDTGVSEVVSVVDDIDNNKSVVSCEYNEEDTAVMEFMARNSAAVIRSGGGYIIGVTPEPSASSGPMFTLAPITSGSPAASASAAPTATPIPVTEQTEDEIRENLRRTVHVILGMKEEILEGGTKTFYTVRVYYEYQCKNISNMDPTNPDVYETSDLINTNVQELEGIYLMFNKCHLTEDRFEFEWEGTLNPPAGKYPEIRLVCQDIGIAGTPDPDPSASPAATTMPVALDTYKPTIYFKNFSGWTDWNPQIRTNLVSPSEFLYDSSSDVAGTWQVPAPLTDSGSPVRLFKIKVDVYRKGERGVAGKEPIVSMITSKTE